MPEDAERALPLLDRALHLDPDDVSAHALAAWCHEWRFHTIGVPIIWKGSLRFNTLARRRPATTHSLRRSPDFPWSSSLRNVGNRWKPSTRVSALNPCSATAMYLSAHAHSIADQHAAAAVFADRALQSAQMTGSLLRRIWRLAKARFAKAVTTMQPNASPARPAPNLNSVRLISSAECRKRWRATPVERTLLYARGTNLTEFSNSHVVRDRNGAGARARTRRNPSPSLERLIASGAVPTLSRALSR